VNWGLFDTNNIKVPLQKKFERFLTWVLSWFLSCDIYWRPDGTNLSFTASKQVNWGLSDTNNIKVPLQKKFERFLTWVLSWFSSCDIYWRPDGTNLSLTASKHVNWGLFDTNNIKVPMQKKFERFLTWVLS
jgi:hypothetical protein